MAPSCVTVPGASPRRPRPAPRRGGLRNRCHAFQTDGHVSQVRRGAVGQVRNNRRVAKARDRRNNRLCDLLRRGIRSNDDGRVARNHTVASLVEFQRLRPGAVVDRKCLAVRN